MNPDEYKSYAGFYDRLLTPLLRQLRVDIRTFINYRGYRNVIDICCGTGDQLQMLERDGLHLVGIDSSSAMLERARNRCSDTVTFYRLDAAQMHPPAEPFDCALLVFSLHEKHATIRNQIFHNARRMVKQGGALIIADYSGAVEGTAASIIGRLLLPIIERCAGTTHYHNYTDWMKNGALEGFFDRHRQPVDIISRPYTGTVLCAAVTVNDTSEAQNRQFALLHQSLQAQTIP